MRQTALHESADRTRAGSSMVLCKVHSQVMCGNKAGAVENKEKVGKSEKSRMHGSLGDLSLSWKDKRKW